MFNEIQKYKNEFYRFDVDSSPEVYALYEKIYPKNIRDKYCISTPKFFRYISLSKGYIDAPDVALINRLFALPPNIPVKENIWIQNRRYEMYDAAERLSGDCFFNFNNYKIKRLKQIHGVDEEKLKICSEMHHSIYNMVLLQTMGNMQKRKQQGLQLSPGKYEQLDRGDTFLYLLNKFYKEKNEKILAASTQANKESLRKYLLNFKDVEDYADNMLQINEKEFINKLIENGKKQLDSSNVNDYLDIALEFWKKRKCKIDPMIEDNNMSIGIIGEKDGFIIRPAKTEDAVSYYEQNYCPPDKEAARLTGCKEEFSKEEVISFFLKSIEEDDRYFFLIIAPNGEIIGESVINEIDRDLRSANFRIGLYRQTERGKGIGTWATEITRDFAFEELKLHRLELDVYSFNPNAEKVYLKAGFKREGVLRDAVMDGDKYADDILMSILESEWKELKKTE